MRSSVRESCHYDASGIPARPYYIGVMLRPVARTERARTEKQAQGEILALRLFDQADGALVTRADVETAMERWRAHPETCGCGICAAARSVSVSWVYTTVWAWQASIQRTRRLARR